MTVREGVLRLISLMFGAVNPGQPAPPTNLSGDYVIAIVDGSHQTVVTPSNFAGVEFPAGAAPQPFVLVIQENNFDSGEPCSGPLITPLCQYPRFYRFDPFPHVSLDKVATFGVCVVVDGPRAPSKEIDDRLRLAHDAPAGAPRPGYQTVGNAEILPYVQTDFLECRPPKRGTIGLLERLLLPAKAYAIDLGGGGTSDEFSNFNVVDPGPRSTDELPPIVIAPPGNGKPPKIPRDR